MIAEEMEMILMLKTMKIPFENENARLLFESIRMFFPNIELNWDGEELTEREALKMYHIACRRLKVKTVPYNNTQIMA